MKQLSFIGGEAGFGSNNTSAYAIIDNNLLLIDCGSTVFSKLFMMDKARNFLNKRDNIEVIITHMHDDHVGSLGQLINYCFYFLHKKVTIYSKCINLETRLNIAAAPKEGYEIITDSHINFIKTNHCLGMDSYGFQMTINDRNVVYTGDTNTLEPFYNYIDYGTELYVDISYYNNPAHLNIKYIFDVINRLSLNGIDVYLMHLDNKKEIINYINNTNIKLFSDNQLNKQDIINILNDYDFDKNKYRVISGAAMVLYGFKEFTKDIDITVTKDYYAYLLNNYDCTFDRINEINEPIFYIDNIINFGNNYFNSRKNIVDDIPVQTKKDLIELKQNLNREKDIKELKLIK